MRRLRSLRPAVLACVLPALLLAAPGCDKEEETSCPQVCQGRIEGYVLGGNGPVRARLGAFAFEDGEPKVVVLGNTDPSGHYELNVPSGEFLLAAETYDSCTDVYHSAMGIALEDRWAASVAVELTPVRVDLLGGGLTLAVDVPQAVGDSYVSSVIEGVSVHGHESTCQTSNQEGHWVFEYPLLPPGTYLAQVRFSSQEYWLPSGDRTSADTIEVLAGQTTTRSIRIPPPAYILGSVQGSWQAMDAAAPEIVAFRGEDDPIGNARADAAGAFSMELYSPGRIRLRVDGPGPSLWVGGQDFAHATIFEVDSADTIRGVSVVESGIQCQLAGPPEEELSHALVSLWNDSGTLLLDGREFIGAPLAICNLAPGSYRLAIAPHCGRQHWLPRFYDGAESLEAATPIVIATEGQVVPVALHLSVSGWITGRVLRSDGAGAPGASVFLSPANDPSRITLATQSADYDVAGAFAIPHLHTGDYKVGARLGSAPTTWYPGTADWDSAGVINVVEGSETSGIDWQLLP